MHYTSTINLTNKLIYTFKKLLMNKYQKNMLWFNIEKLIATIIALSFIVLMAFTLNSCTSTQQAYNAKYHKNYCDNCPIWK